MANLTLVLCDEAVRILAERAYPLIAVDNRFRAETLTFHLMEVAYKSAWFGMEYPQLVIGSASIISMVLAKVRGGGKVDGDKMGWVEGSCWFHGARFFVSNDFPIGELFFFNPSRITDGRFHASISWVVG